MTESAKAFAATKGGGSKPLVSCGRDSDAAPEARDERLKPALAAATPAASQDAGSSPRDAAASRAELSVGICPHCRGRGYLMDHHFNGFPCRCRQHRQIPASAANTTAHQRREAAYGDAAGSQEVPR